MSLNISTRTRKGGLADWRNGSASDPRSEGYPFKSGVYVIDSFIVGFPRAAIVAMRPGQVCFLVSFNLPLLGGGEGSSGS